MPRTPIREEQRNAAEGVSAETSIYGETPIAARRADALERIADHYLTSEESAVNGGDRCTLHRHTDMDTLRADGDGAQAELDSGGNVSAETCLRSLP